MAKCVTPTRFWLVRHAPVEGYRDHPGRICGRLDLAADLSDRATLAGLAAALPREAVLIASPLVRARQTAGALAAQRGWEVTAIIPEPDLVEQDFGAWEGLSHDQTRAADGAAHARFWADPAQAAPPRGESFAAVVERVGRALDRLASTHVGAEMIVVAHAGPIRAALAVALQVPPRTALAFRLDPLSLTVIERYPAVADTSATFAVGCVNRSFVTR